MKNPFKLGKQAVEGKVQCDGDCGQTHPAADMYVVRVKTKEGDVDLKYCVPCLKIIEEIVHDKKRI
mgnify:CR=1 FL=1